MKIGSVISAMIAYLRGNRHEVEHMLKVYGYAKAIGELEGLDVRTQEILEVAAVVHDIGIPRAIEKYGNDAGPYQEELGPAEAKKLLGELGYDEELVDRVCALVGRHHTYTNVDGMDCRILLEADYLVNASHNKHAPEAISAAKGAFFRTETGMRFLKENFGV
ncbi:MAG: HD domain-containing protein [Clostridia bacterium]|nr:HD domain-containing protein [Clostridia bacterium]